jgi:Lsr2
VVALVLDQRLRTAVIYDCSTRRPRRQSGDSGRNDSHEIRQWAEANGYDVSPRGRIKKEVIEAYDQAHR